MITFWLLLVTMAFVFELSIVMPYWKQISFTRLMMFFNPSSAYPILLIVSPFILIPSVIFSRASLKISSEKTLLNRMDQKMHLWCTPLKLSIFLEVFLFVLIVAVWWQYRLLSSLTFLPSTPNLMSLLGGTLSKACAKSTKQIYRLFCWPMHFCASTCRLNKAFLLSMSLLKPSSVKG